MNAGAPPDRGRRHLFVYWRLDPAALAPAVAALRDLHRRWQHAQPALEAELYVRAGDAGTATVMETYAVRGADDEHGISDSLQQLIEAQADAATARWRLGSRHVECFDRCA